MHIEVIEEQLNSKILSHRTVSGGDINRAYLIETKEEKYFVKCNTLSSGDRMLQTEKQALQHLHKFNPQFAPRPISYLEDEGMYYLIMEYIESGSDRMSLDSQEDLAKVVYNLHQHQSSHFGWSTDNFIGALPQYNNTEKEELTWPEFYWKYRILPQLKMAVSGNYFEKSIYNIETALISKVASFYKEEQVPALTHGDLWSGNYLVDKHGNARLIDPAICYSHPDMDLGMSKQFGGFSLRFYEQYYELAGSPATPLAEKSAMFQLYYVLVHLNLFGSGYLSQTESILRQYGLR